MIDFIAGCICISFPQIMDDLRTVFERNLIRINASNVGSEFLQAALLIANQLGIDFHCYRAQQRVQQRLDRFKREAEESSAAT